jgi:hypothetical protein
VNFRQWSGEKERLEEICKKKCVFCGKNASISTSGSQTITVCFECAEEQLHY